MKNPLIHLVKDACIDQEDGEVLGAYTWDMPDRPTMHGSNPKWDGQTAQGNLMRMSAKPQGSRGPGGSRRPEGRRP